MIIMDSDSGKRSSRCNSCPCKCKENISTTAIVIVVSGFIINAIYGGFTYTPGLYLNSFLEEYNAGKTVTAWVISIQGSLLYFSGIIAGPLTARYGTRIVAVAGSLLSTCGFLLSAFSPNVAFLYLSFGLMTGIGFGLLLIPNGVAVQQHTSERRALAAGIVFSGSGLGAFIMPLITKWAMITYGWRGSLIFLSGILLHNLPCALLLRPPPPCLPPGDIIDQELNLITEEKSIITSSRIEMKTPDSNSFTTSNQTDHIASRLTANDTTLILKNSLQQKVINGGSTLNLTLVYASALSINQWNSMTRSESITKSARFSNLRNCWKSFQLFFTPSFGESEPLLTPVTVLGIASWFFYFAGMPVLYVFMPVKAVSMGYETTMGATLISFAGIGEISGRIIGALLGTMHERLPLLIYASMAMMAGACTAAIILCTTYHHMMMTCIGYGIAAGMATGMITTALRDLIGINRLPWAVGMAFTFGGIGNLLAIQTLAYAWEQTGSFFIPYLIGGALLVMSAVCIIGAKIMRKSRNIKEDSVEIDAE